MRILLMSVAALALAACGQTEVELEQPKQAPIETAQPDAPSTVPPTMSTHDMLVDCAGAIAAAGDVDPMQEPHLDTPAENNLWTVLALMDKEPGLEGSAGRQSAVMSKENWEQRPTAEAAARGSECMAHFGGGQ
ncbi:MAG: hypothetical protein ABW199_05480 [Caulobacterales bacterium]